MRLSSPEGCPVCPFPLRTGRAGAINVNGTVGPLASGLPLSLHGTIKELAPLHRNDLSVTLSGTADIVGPGDVARCARGHHRQ